MNDITIRSASVDDAADILRIYEYYVRETAISFEYDVPTLDDMKARITKTLQKYPYFVAEHHQKNHRICLRRSIRRARRLQLVCRINDLYYGRRKK